ALVKVLRGEQVAADALLKQVLELGERVPLVDIDYAEPLERLGELSAQQGRTEEARRLWERAMEIYEELDLGEDRARVHARLNGLGRSS
ncbi:MAG: tetratricopeptide repeat protein, partial [Myxococcota bacterium]